MIQGGFKKKSKANSEIPSSSLADMAFLLLIFFMVSTTFPKEKPRRLPFPEAEQTKKIDEPRKNVMHVWLEKDGRVYINDRLVPMEEVSAIVAPAYEETDRKLVVSLRADRDVPYQWVDAVTKELQEAHAVRVTFHTDLEQRVTRERR